ncbi:MAG: hypothetical protein ACP5VS_05990 [Desulfomonilaceae bacterium]
MLCLPQRFLIIVGLFVFCTRPALADTTLSDLATWANYAAIDNQLATVNIKAIQQRLDIDRAKQGLSIFAGAGFGNNRTAISTTSTLNYQSANFQLGLSLPLLGSAEKLDKSVMSTRLSLQLARIRRQQTKTAVLHLLLTANSQLYFATQRIAYDEIFLQIESGEKQMLSARMHAHFLLKSDELKFLSMFALAKRELLKDQAEQQAALSILEELTGHTLSRYHPTAPALYPSENLENSVLAASDRILPVQMAEVVLHARNELAQKLPWEGVHANLVLAQSVVRGIGVPSGFATTIGVQLDMPLDIIHERTILRREESVLIEQAQLSLKKSRLEATQNAYAAVSAIRRNQQNMLVSWQQLEGACAALEIAQLRAHAIAGDVQEKTLQRKYSLYLAAIAYNQSLEGLAQSIISAKSIDGLSLSHQLLTNAAQSSWLNTEVTGALVGEKNSDVTSALAALKENWSEEVRHALASSHVRAASTNFRHGQSLGWYIWNTTILLSKGDNSVHFPGHTKRLEISFTAHQMQQLMDHHEIAGLRRFINLMERADITVNWLIGDPGLVTTSGREVLLKWLPIMHKLKFNGIVLDVERSQLSDSKKIIWKSGILKTIAAIHHATNWPITLTINYRELENKYLVERLLKAGISTAAAMIYIRNTDHVEQIITPILKSHPNLPIIVVQSIEPKLSSAESTNSLGQRGSITHWQNLARALGKYSNFRGIDVQSWQDFFTAKP